MGIKGNKNADTTTTNKPGNVATKLPNTTILPLARP